VVGKPTGPPAGVARPGRGGARARGKGGGCLVRTFVKAYSAIVGGSQLNLSPVDVAATADGGSIALVLATSPKGLGEDWLVKLSAAGVPQWQ